MLDYLEHNRDVPYSNPDAVTDPDEKARLLDVKQKGQDAAGELKKMASLCQEKFGLDKCLSVSWLDGSNTKTRKYLWAQMKYSDRADDPTSVSIFVEMRNDTQACYRISLEIKNDSTDKKTMERYHSHLDLPLNQDAGLVYVSGSNEWGRPEPMKEKQYEIRDKVKVGELRKVQICKFIDQKADQTNEYFEAELLRAVEALMPYYNHVVGKDKETIKPAEDDDMPGAEVAPDKEPEKIEYDKNMILYGPPGTGKTYSTSIYAVAICDNKSINDVKQMSYNDVMARYDELKNAGRVAFTTFHQSYGYEEFIEGIKPVVDEDSSSLDYTIESGVFKKFCERARMPEKTELEFTGKVWAIRNRAGDKDLTFDYEEYLYTNGVVLVESMDKDDKRQCNLLGRMEKGDWVVLGREYKIAAIGVVADYEPTEVDCPPFHWQRKVEWLGTNLGATFADIDIRGGCFSNFAVAKSKYKAQDFYKLIDKESKELKPYVFVIDEINRGNISKIFGELITLIEDTKREGMPEQASAVLPYSGKTFSVPENVYLLGTMNTADRSIALMDTALRRRFQFTEMMPDSSVLREIGADKVDDLDVAHMLDVINERITFLYDREHTIGHAFFTKLANSPTIDTLASIFEKSVIPLLQEYFYEDYQKIQLVLGDNGKTDPAHKFILDEEVKVKSIFKGNADDVVDLPEKKYSINPEAFKNLDAYKEII